MLSPLSSSVMLRSVQALGGDGGGNGDGSGGSSIQIASPDTYSLSRYPVSLLRGA